ncbi:MAG: GTPase domain-containing protein [Planctomycetaceae bacterium]|nr:GTPase domain-containing protein [Planctomycetaceae bacterium]
MSHEPLYSFLENDRFNRENSYNERQLREFFNQGRIGHNTELWLWDGEHSRLAGTYESLFIRNRRFKERRLGIFGTKNSGKTAFLNGCTKYGKRFNDGSIVIDRNGNDPLLHEISTVEFSLLNNGMAWEIQTQDHSGHLINSEQTEKINEWFAECDAILLLIDCTKIIEQSDQTERIRRFLDQLRRRSPDGNRIDKPIAIVWTKTDLVNLSSITEQKQEIQIIVETFGKQETVEIFNVSIFDPGNLVKPIHWAVRKIDEMKYENVVRSGLTSKRKILNEYKSLRDVWGINRGELGRKVKEQIAKLEKELQRFNVIVCVLFFAILSIVLFFLIRSFPGKRIFLDFLSAQEKMKQADKREEVETVLKNYRQQFWTSPKYVAEIEKLAQERKRELAERENELAFEVAKYAVEYAETPEKIDKAIDKFHHEAPAPTKEQLDKLTTLATEKRRVLRFETALTHLRTEIERSPDFAKTKRLYDRFFETIAVADYPEQAVVIDGIRLELKQLIEDERKGMAFLPVTAFFEKVKRIDEQLKAFNKNDPQFQNLEEERTKIAADWERYDYEKFYRSVVKVRTAEELKNVKGFADQYLLETEKRASLRISSPKKENVENWLAWFDGLRREHPFELTVSSILVPKTFFATPNQEGKIIVTLQIGKSKAEITIPQLDEVQKKSDSVLFPLDLKCSVDNAVWDEKKRTKIVLTVAEYREGWRYLGFPVSRLVCEVADSEYPYMEFCPMPDGVFTFSNENTTITVTTDPKSLAMPVKP